MKRSLIVWSCVLPLIFLALTAVGKLSPPSETPILARVELAGEVSSFALPVHGFLQDASGKDYLLVFASKSKLQAARWPWKQLDRDVAPEEVVIATELRSGARQSASGRFPLLLDDGRQWILRLSPQNAEHLAQLGFDLQRLTAEPLVLRQNSPDIAFGPDPPAFGPEPTEPDPLVCSMIESVQTTNLWWLVRRLSGEEPVITAGESTVIRTRHTTSGLPLQQAVGLATERFAALGLQVSTHVWSSSGYTGTNIVATLPGVTNAHELVLMTAHLDNMPAGLLAPGADDNASGCAAVLTAAGILSQYRFDRSIRFILFTGEEQGLLGSARYAAAALAAGDNIVGVLNLDMIAWNRFAPPTFQIHTRAVSNPGYPKDFVIASMFTNVAAVYNLRTNFTPTIKTAGTGSSDHASFWNRGFAAVCAIEEYPGDFNAYYHTVNDKLQFFNMPYFTAATRTAVATAAHLATPLERITLDVVEVGNSDWSPGSGIGSGVLLARHVADASETGADKYDSELSLTSQHDSAVGIVTRPYGLDLVTDSRPGRSESIFRSSLTAVSSSGALACSNALRFDFVSLPAADRIYTARIEVGEGPSSFVCATNLRQLVARGGLIQLPFLQQSTTNASYGTCDIAIRSLETNCSLQLVSIDGPNVILQTHAQVGIEIFDELETSTDPAGPWTSVTTFTDALNPDPQTFDSGWKTLNRAVTVSTPTSPHFFRLKRSFLHSPD